MSYTKKTWKNYPDTTTPITADNLNHMENGIADAHTEINALNTSLNQFSFRPNPDDTTKGQYSLDGGKTFVNFSSGAEPVVLWTNPAPTSAFASQTINVDYSDYDYILLEFKLINDSYPTYTTMTRTTQKNVRLMARMTDYPITKWYSRTFTLLDNSISFEGGEPSNGYGIPLKICGCNAISVPAKYKGVVEDLGTTSLPHTINCKKDTAYMVTVTVTSGYEPLPCPISNCEVLANTPRRGYTISYVVKATSNTMVVGTSIGSSVIGLFVAEC